VHSALKGCHYHGLRGSASPVLTVTGFVNGRWQFSLSSVNQEGGRYGGSSCAGAKTSNSRKRRQTRRSAGFTDLKNPGSFRLDFDNS